MGEMLKELERWVGKKGKAGGLLKESTIIEGDFNARTEEEGKGAGIKGEETGGIERRRIEVGDQKIRKLIKKGRCQWNSQKKKGRGF